MTVMQNIIDRVRTFENLAAENLAAAQGEEGPNQGCDDPHVDYFPTISYDIQLYF